MDDHLGNYQRRLSEAVEVLESCHSEIKRLAHERDSADFTTKLITQRTFIGLFQFTWDFPNVEPPRLPGSLET